MKYCSFEEDFSSLKTFLGSVSVSSLTSCLSFRSAERVPLDFTDFDDQNVAIFFSFSCATENFVPGMEHGKENTTRSREATEQQRIMTFRAAEDSMHQSQCREDR